MNLILIVIFFFAWIESIAQVGVKDSTKVYFGFNKAILSMDQEKQLLEVVSRWKKVKFEAFNVNGYTDSVGTESYNMQLALKRAGYVRKILVNHLSLANANLTINSYGEGFARTAPDSLNRNVTVVIVYDQSDSISSVGGVNSVKREKNTLSRVDTVIRLSNIQFIEDLPYLTPHAHGVMPAYIQLIRRLGFDHMEVVGYYYYEGEQLRTDDPRYKLSAERAHVVADIFREAGFDSSKISWKGAGNDKLVVENAVTVDDMRKNIRVEVILYSDWVRK